MEAPMTNDGSAILGGIPVDPHLDRQSACGRGLRNIAERMRPLGLRWRRRNAKSFSRVRYDVYGGFQLGVMGVSQYGWLLETGTSHLEIRMMTGGTPMTQETSVHTHIYIYIRILRFLKK